MRILFVLGLVGVLAMITWWGAQHEEFGWGHRRRPVQVTQTNGKGVTVTVIVYGEGVKRKWLGEDYRRRFHRRRREERISWKMRELEEQMRRMSNLFEEDEDYYGGFWDYWQGLW